MLPQYDIPNIEVDIWDAGNCAGDGGGVCIVSCFFFWDGTCIQCCIEGRGEALDWPSFFFFFLFF